MKRITSSTSSKSHVTASSYEEVNIDQMESLTKALKSARDIMDRMDYITFQAVKDYCGNDFYDDILESGRVLDLNF